MAKYGSRGADVRALQHALGLYVDGSFGSKTKQAVIAYQMENRLVADGIVGAKTWAVLLPQLKSVESRKVNRDVFFAELRKSLFKGGFKQSQVDGINTKLDEMESEDLPVNQMAYIFATVYHETGIVKNISGRRIFENTMQPVREMDKGGNRPYARNLRMSRKPYSLADVQKAAAKLGFPAANVALPIYYGRGDVQLTWFENYEKATRETGVDVLQYPDRALELNLSAKIIIKGMMQGWFTGKKLSDYIGDYTANYVAARRIINGVDKQDKIAAEAVAFELALRRAKM